jgi:flagellar motor switch protein FliN/FliY
MPLSQDQIDALLGGGGGGGSAPADGALTPAEIDALAELSTTAFTSGATAATQALGRKVVIATPAISTCTADDLKREYPQDQILINVAFTVGSAFDTALLLRERDGAIIFDLLMGRDGKNPDPQVGELQISAVGEIMNQVLGNAATAMSGVVGAKVEVSPPATSLGKAGDPDALGFGGTLVKVVFQMQMEDLPDTELVQVMPLASAQGLINAAQKKSAPAPVAAAPAAAPQPQPAMAAAAPAASYAAPAPAAAPMGGYAAPAAGGGGGNFGGRAVAAPGQPVAVQTVQFSPLPGGPDDGTLPSSLDLVMDIPLRVTVELGATKLKIKDVLELGRGSVVELSRLAGEPVDLMVNGKLMAKGEVVVINENFGLRITEIVGRAERMNGLNLR